MTFQNYFFCQGFGVTIETTFEVGFIFFGETDSTTKRMLIIILIMKTQFNTDFIDTSSGIDSDRNITLPTSIYKGNCTNHIHSTLSFFFQREYLTTSSLWNSHQSTLGLPVYIIRLIHIIQDQQHREHNQV